MHLGTAGSTTRVVYASPLPWVVYLSSTLVVYPSCVPLGAISLPVHTGLCTSLGAPRPYTARCSTVMQQQAPHCRCESHLGSVL